MNEMYEGVIILAFTVGEKFSWGWEVALKKMEKTQEILGLKSLYEAGQFLLEQNQPLICDGCNVRTPWEHRCHGERAQVRGEPTGKRCQCAECFVGENLLDFSTS